MAKATVQESDPLDINRRLYLQLGKLLDDMEAADADERMTMPQRINALIAIGRVQVLFNTIRKGSVDGGYSGSSVRKYSAAFARPDAARGRKGAPRSTANVVPFDSGGDDEPDPDAA